MVGNLVQVRGGRPVILTQNGLGVRKETFDEGSGKSY